MAKVMGRALPIVVGCVVVTPKLLTLKLVETIVVGCVVVTPYEDTVVLTTVTG